MIRISCKNERFTYDMYHIVKSFLPDAEISQKVDPEQELLIEMTAEEEPDLEEQACDKKVRWTFFHCREAEIADISEKREQKRYINKKLYQTLVKKTGEEHAWGNMTGVRPTKMIMERLEEQACDKKVRWTFFHCREAEIADISEKREQKRYINKKLYQTLVKKTGEEHAWGNMTGVRPTKMIMERLEEGSSEEEIIRYMHDTYVVSEKKAMLGIEIAKREKAQLDKLDYENGYSLYIGIPFCPTTCSYCSFTSYPVAKWQDRMDEYVDALLKELAFIAEVSKEKHLNAIYMGGGTPTTLSAQQMDRVLSFLEEHFSFEHLKEYTIEAGRPDSITEDKLRVIRKHGVGRISINPQTMQQKTLDVIGRRHTVEDVVRIFHLARELGFDNINMDLIAGLPGEHPEEMEDTLRQIKELAPDSLTVHALAMKHGSRLTRERAASAEKQNYKQMARELEEMIDMARKAAGEMGLYPYYLYRQKNIAGNFENVGYAKVDKAGIYNILIMEEKQSIVAAGAGASTKVVLPYEIPAPGSKNGRMTNLIRIENVRDVGEYISRIDEMIERKGEWLWH